MSTIAEIEDRLIETIEGLGAFRDVRSLGRRELPAAAVYPAAYVYFVSDRDTGTRPRPVRALAYDVVVVSKNLRSEKEAARDAYALIDAVRDAVNGKTLGLSGIEEFACESREIADYESGAITYSLRFTARQYLDVPVG